MIRTTAPIYPQEPYNWSADSKFQCTGYAYYRALEEGFTAPCYGNRATKQGSYTNAKEWLDNFREPGEVKGPEYTPVHGDIAVFDGEYGHVIFIEDGNGLISEYNRVAKEQFDTDTWVFGSRLAGCGPLLGYLHFPNNVVSTMSRDTSVDQIETTDSSLRVRLQPNLNGEVYCHVQIGYYNVLSQTQADGFTWYEIAPQKYCANETTIFLPADGKDILKEIETYLEAMKQKTEDLSDENKQLKNTLNQIHQLSRWES